MLLMETLSQVLGRLNCAVLTANKFGICWRTVRIVLDWLCLSYGLHCAFNVTLIHSSVSAMVHNNVQTVFQPIFNLFWENILIEEFVSSTDSILSICVKTFACFIASDQNVLWCILMWTRYYIVILTLISFTYYWFMNGPTKSQTNHFTRGTPVRRG